MSLAALRAALVGEARLVTPFFVLGDPTPELSVELAVRAVEAGAGGLELGLPYGDPVADGPEVAAASLRALAAGTTTSRALECLRQIAERTGAPLNLLVYANLVHARGWERFAREAAGVGASSLLCPDVGLEESAPLARACAAADLGLVQLVGPRTPDARVRALGRASSAFVYLVSHQGVTGARDALAPGAAERVARVAALAGVPVCVGFGLSHAAHCRAAFDAGARLAVVGSALARRIRRATEAGLPGEALLAELEEACRELARAAAPAPTENPPERPEELSC